MNPPKFNSLGTVGNISLQYRTGFHTVEKYYATVGVVVVNSA